MLQNTDTPNDENAHTHTVRDIQLLMNQVETLEAYVAQLEYDIANTKAGIAELGGGYEYGLYVADGTGGWISSTNPDHPYFGYGNAIRYYDDSAAINTLMLRNTRFTLNNVISISPGVVSASTTNSIGAAFGAQLRLAGVMSLNLLTAPVGADITMRLIEFAQSDLAGGWIPRRAYILCSQEL